MVLAYIKPHQIINEQLFKFLIQDNDQPDPVVVNLKLQNGFSISNFLKQVPADAPMKLLMRDYIS